MGSPLVRQGLSHQLFILKLADREENRKRCKFFLAFYVVLTCVAQSFNNFTVDQLGILGDEGMQPYRPSEWRGALNGV